MKDLTSKHIEIRSIKTGKVLAIDKVVEHNSVVKRPYIKVKHNTKRYYIDVILIQLRIK